MIGNINKENLESLSKELQEKNSMIFKRILDCYNKSDEAMQKTIEDLAKQYCPGLINFQKGELTRNSN